jgi:murein DD-endopeptidase MepM/ murein hydrolase activator NlpD
MFARRSTQVVAPVSGVVTLDANRLGGNAVALLGDDGNSYYFAHLDRYGAFGRVTSGTVIGTVGNTGNANGAPTHLYFEIRPSNGRVVDPYPTIRSACR